MAEKYRARMSIRELRRAYGTENRTLWRRVLQGSVGGRERRLSSLRKNRLTQDFNKSNRGRTFLERLGVTGEKLSKEVAALRAVGSSSSRVISKAKSGVSLKEQEKNYLNALIARHEADIQYSKALVAFLKRKGAFKSTIAKLEAGIASLQDIVDKLKRS